MTMQQTGQESESRSQGISRHNGGQRNGGGELRARRGHGSESQGREQAGEGERLANGLGWFSIGLGLAQLAAPGAVARLIGVRDDGDNRALLQTVGVREIASGVGILTQPRPASMLVGRVGGDIMDLVLLGSALRSPDDRSGRVTAATAAVIGVTILDLIGAQKLLGQSTGNGRRARMAERGRTRRTAGTKHGIDVREAITVNRSPDEVYTFWRDFQNLPRFMSHLKSVELKGNGQSHWVAKAPAGTSVEWDAEIVNDDPGQLIAWRSLAGADVDNEGSVRFVRAPGGRGTEIMVTMQYRPPAGALGALVAKLFGEAPEQQIKSDLRRFKQVMETGEVVHSDASIHRGPHPARPPSEPMGMSAPMGMSRQSSGPTGM